MASPRVDSGFGATVAFSTDTNFTSRSGSSGSYELSNINVSGPATEALPTTHMGSGAAFASGSIGNATFIPNDIVDPGTLTLEGHFNPDFVFTSGSQQTVTVTWPSGATWVAPGFLLSDSADSPFDGIMTRTIVIKLSGAIAITPAPAPSG